MAREINRAQLTGYDFNTILDDIRANFATLFGAQFSETVGDPANTLLDMIAYALDGLFFYLDRRTNESYSQVARQRSSLALLTRMLGYKLTTAIPSSTDVKVTLGKVYAFPVTLPKGTQFATASGIVFESAEEVTFASGDGPKLVPVYQGETVTERFASDGTALQRFAVRRFPQDTYPVSGSTRVIVDGVQWVESKFLTFDQTNQYETRFNLDPPQLVFGDGVVGNIPATGAEIVATYIASRGKSGNVGAGLINRVVSRVVANFTTITLSCTNSERSTGGDDPQTLEQAKAFAGQLFKARGVAITESDFAALAGSYADPVAGKVAVARAISAKSSAGDATLSNALTIIESLATAFIPAVDGQLALAREGLDTARENIAALLTAITAITTANTTGYNANLSGLAGLRSLKNRTVEVETDAGDIRTLVLEAKAAIDAIAVGTTSTLTVSDKAALKDYLDRINTESNGIGSAATNIKSTADTAITALNSAQAQLDVVGRSTSTLGTQVNALETARLALVSSVGVPDTTGVYANLAAIDVAIADTTQDTFAQTGAIRAHFDRILSADCQANLVSILILAKDEGGFYAPPSNALRKAVLQDLQTRKAVETVLEVESGENFLVRAVVSIRAGVIPGTVAESVVRSGLLAVADNVLRLRAFGDPLYLEEFYRAARVIAGLKFVNIAILGHYNSLNVVDTSKLDGSGNLTILATEVVTKGDVTVAVETVFTS